MDQDKDYDSFDDDMQYSTAQPAKRKRKILAGNNDESEGDSNDSFFESFIDPSPAKKARISPLKRRSPKKIIPDSPEFDPNVKGFPSLSELSLSANDSRQMHLLVSTVERSEGMTTLSCEEVDENNKGKAGRKCTVYLQGIWNACEVKEGGRVRILRPKKWTDNEWLIDDESGLLISHCDTLVPCTTVVQSFFCARKAVLSERLKSGGNDVSKAMLMGIIIHQLFQAALVMKGRISKEWLLSRWREQIMDEVLVSLTAINFSPEQFESELEPYIEEIITWTNNYVPRGKERAKPVEGGGSISEVHDIEENLWVPMLGLKGKVDVTVEMDSSSWLLPLELKTGKSSQSADHAGQVLMYTMMLAQRYSLPIREGSLLYLKDGTSRRVVPKSGDLRAILSQRNLVASFVHNGVPPSSLPVPRGDTHFCKKCDYAGACALYAKVMEHDGEGEDKENRETKEVTDEAFAFQIQMTEHLDSKHLGYFKRWTRWIWLEMEASKRDKRPASHIWDVDPRTREEESPLNTMSHLRVVSCGESPQGRSGYIACLKRLHPSSNPIPFHSGEFVVVSTTRIPALVMGPVLAVDTEEGTVSILSDRRLPLAKRKFGVDDEDGEVFHLDRHESYSSYSIQLNSLVALMSVDERSNRLRRLLIDESTPCPTRMKTDEVAKVKGIMKGLNKGQVSAVVKSLCAADYALIEGLPGSGKTSTLVSLVRGVVALGRDVLVTAYTHSAVDNLLSKVAQFLPSDSLLRLGRSSSVHSSVQSLTLDHKLSDCATPTQKFDRARHILATTPVIAVTSLAAATHPLFSWRRFSLCIVDESSLVLESSLVSALLPCDRFVLVGDAKQLAPLVQSKEAKEEGMAVSLFERLLIAHRKDHAVTLDRQYRMNSVLSSIPSSLFYDNCLFCANEQVANASLDTVYEDLKDKAQQLRKAELIPSWMDVIVDGALDSSAVFVDIPFKGDEDTVNVERRGKGEGGVSREEEADVVLKIVNAFKQLEIPVSSVGVMAMYRKQTELLRRKVAKGVEVNTVDQWQGRDSEIVICSLAWTISDGKTRSDLLSDSRRLNVAVTRAKHKLIILGCRQSMIDRCPKVAEIISKMKVVQYCQ